MQQYKDTTLEEPNMANMAALYQQYAPSLVAYLCQHTPSGEDAEDILVEVFLTALENKQFSSLPEKAQLSWLWRVARNKVVDTYRRSARRPSVALDSIIESINDDDISPERFALQQEEYNNLQGHIKSLSPLQQKVLWLRFSQDMRCSEIAVHIGKPLNRMRLLCRTAFFTWVEQIGHTNQPVA